MELKDKILEKFRNPNKYETNPIFNSVVNSLRYGASPYHLIEDIIEIVENYRNENLKQLKYGTTQRIIVSKETYENIENNIKTGKNWNEFINEFKKIV
jgi:hypothetical protein